MYFGIAANAVEPTGANERKWLFRAVIGKAALRAEKRVDSAIDDGGHAANMRREQPILKRTNRIYPCHNQADPLPTMGWPN